MHLLACLFAMLALIFRPVLGSQQAHPKLLFINPAIFCCRYFETLVQIKLEKHKNPKETSYSLSTSITDAEKITGLCSHWHPLVLLTVHY